MTSRQGKVADVASRPLTSGVETQTLLIAGRWSEFASSESVSAPRQEDPGTMGFVGRADGDEAEAATDEAAHVSQPNPSTVRGGHRFAVFLSHNSRDKPAVESLAEKLRQVGLEPWLDRWYLTGGDVWQDDLAAALRASSTCAVFVGPNGFGDWAREELLVAQDRAAKDRTFRLIPVLLPGLADPFDAGSVLPPFLSMRMWVDLRAGIEDPANFQRLVSAITGVPPGPVGPAEPLAQTPPYRGLRQFEEEQADFFFGRDADAQRLLEKLKGSRFLVVLGPSGSGKSSLVRAGLVPALRRGGVAHSGTWPIYLLRPGPRPLEELSVYLAKLSGAADELGAARQFHVHLLDDRQALHLAVRLATPGTADTSRAVLVVDQFEEVFTLCHEDAERSAFLSNLVYAATVPDGASMVILTLRADFYPRCAAYPELATQVAAQQYLVSPMSIENLRQVVEKPAHLVGLDLEPGLVDAILEDVASEPGALPLLEHALWELWQRRRGRLLTLQGYLDAGGVAGALARRADEIYAQLDRTEQLTARRVLLRLTEPGEGTEDTRRRATLAELVSRADEGASVEAVVQALATARLLTTSGDELTGEQTVDVAHEALIRGWPRLRVWVDEDRGGLRVLHRLMEAARDWQQANRDAGLLYRGVRLAEATEWRTHNEDRLNDLERRFLDAGVNAAKANTARENRLQRSLYGAQVAGGTVGAGLGFAIAFALALAASTPPNRPYAVTLAVTTALILYPIGQVVGFGIGLGSAIWRRKRLGKVLAPTISGAAVGMIGYTLFLRFALASEISVTRAAVGALLGAGLGLVSVWVTSTRGWLTRLTGATLAGLFVIAVASVVGDLSWPAPVVVIAGVALGLLPGVGFSLFTEPVGSDADNPYITG
jgi:hypothetical protein